MVLASSPLKQLKRFCVDRPQVKRHVKRLHRLGVRALTRPLGTTLDATPMMLGYHTVGDGENDISVSVEQFRRQVTWLIERGVRILTLSTWWSLYQERCVPQGPVVILTFDDGMLGVYTHAAPILKSLGVAGTVFVVTDYVGQTNQYDRVFGAPEVPLMHWEHLQALAQEGWDVQSHGRRHLPLVEMTYTTLREEVQGSRDVIEQRLGTDVQFFCYPYGAFDCETVEAVARAGYAGAVTCWPGSLPTGRVDDAYRLRRTLVDGIMSNTDFVAGFREGYRRFTERSYDGLTECPFDELDKLFGGRTT